MTAPDKTTLYVHVPFCVVKCGYCDFNSYADHASESHDVFLRALERELANADPAPPPSVFIGGGTPTFLDEARFERMLAAIDRHVALVDCEEVTIEANPESVTRRKAEIALAAGVNRFSVGVQSFDSHFLQFLDRAHDAARAEAAFGELRDAGATNLSCDLMFGLPGQTLAQWQSDLTRALALQPDHISCYNLTFEPGTKLTHAMHRGEVEPNDPDVDLAMFEWTRDELARHGFDAYEISNFAGRGGPCRHNDHYWLQGDYLGVGPGAASHTRGERTTNYKVVDRWAKAVCDGERPVGDREVLTAPQRAGEAIWLGLRRRDGVDLDAIGSRLDDDLRARFSSLIDRFTGDGLLACEGSRLTLTDRGIRLADSVSSEFLAS